MSRAPRPCASQADPEPGAVRPSPAGLVTHFTDGYAAALPILRQALNAVGGGMSAEDELRGSGWPGRRACTRGMTSAAGAGAARRRGRSRTRRVERTATGADHARLHADVLRRTRRGGLVDRRDAGGDGRHGSDFAPYGALGLAAMRGRFDEVNARSTRPRSDATHRGEGLGIAHGHWANAVLNNGLGRYEKALAAARSAADYQFDIGSAKWALVELVEAAVAQGTPDEAAAAYERLAQVAGVSGTDWALGIDARARALISEGDAADGLSTRRRSSVSVSPRRADLARAHLLYGEWLRRERRRSEARAHLRDCPPHAGGDGDGGVRGARAARTTRDGGDRCATRTPARYRASSSPPRKPDRADWPTTGCPIPRSAPGCSSAPAPCNTTFARSSPSSGISSRGQLEQVLPAVAETPLH